MHGKMLWTLRKKVKPLPILKIIIMGEEDVHKKIALIRDANML
jgi:hypothetical protein